MPILKTLVSFTNTGGENPLGLQPDGGVIADSAGNLFGTTELGGAGNAGVVFEIPVADGSFASTPTVLDSFDVTDGSGPQAGLVADTNGNLFGTTASGGTGAGTVFEVAKTDGSFANPPTTLVSFDNTDGSVPATVLTLDHAGDLFGETQGGANGTVFEVANTGGGYAETPITLVSFDNTNGSLPEGGLIADAAGDLFGVTAGGGANGEGVVFEIPKSGGGYGAVTTLVTLSAANAIPLGGLVADAAGDLFGTTSEGGSGNDGTVFEIPKTAEGYGSLIDLANLGDAGLVEPTGSLIIDARGDLFGTTTDGDTNDGAVFEIQHADGSYANTPITVFGFSTDTAEGADPNGSLIADAAGDLFGTTRSFGPNGGGTVFELTGAGFQVACYRRGTRIATPTGERPVETLAKGDLVLTASGESQPIAWVGHRFINCRRQPKPQDVWPVRVRTGAFGPGMPHCDIFLSPDHAVLIDGVLIPVRYLVNGATIVQEAADSVSYWHVELDRHSVILAGGLPCETYLDTGNRAAFANGDTTVQMQPEFALRIWDAKACAPLVLGGSRLIAAKRRLLTQAAALGFVTGNNPGVKVLADRRELPSQTDGRRWRVRLPAGTRDVRVTSRAFIPAHTRPDEDDMRLLGVAISRIWLGGREVSRNSQGLASGWHAPEEGWRWTDGNAELALTGVRELTFEIAMTGTYWQDEAHAEVRAA